MPPPQVHAKSLVPERRRVPRPRSGPPRVVLCIVPRGPRLDPFEKRLFGYELHTAKSTTQTLRLARRGTVDLYAVQSPLNWADPIDICKKIRIFDPNTPLIIYAAQPTQGERRDATAAGAQAYLAHSGDPQNLAGTVGQLIMLAELRSMEAMSSKAQAMQEHIARGLAKADVATVQGTGQHAEQVQARIKRQTARIFALAGGSRANFERLWPTIYDGALKKRRGPPERDESVRKS